MTTMGMRVIRAGHDTPNTSNIASKKYATEEPHILIIFLV